MGTRNDLQSPVIRAMNVGNLTPIISGVPETPVHVLEAPKFNPPPPPPPPAGSPGLVTVRR